VPGLASAGLDLDHPVGDLGHLEFEQPLDQTWVSTADDDLGTLGGLADLDDVGLDPATRLGTLELHLLGLREQRLDATQIEQRVSAVGLLDDSGDDVALAVGVLLELTITLRLADALVEHLAERLRGDAAHVVRRVIARIDPVAVFVDVVRNDADVHRVGVDLNLGLVSRVGPPLVCADERICQHLQQRVNGNPFVGSEHADCFGHIETTHAFASSLIW
jgi:hypothetical protein